MTENITKRTTHVIASPHRRTAKVRQAAKRSDRIKIVTQRWLFDSLSQWRKLVEEPYRIHSEFHDDDKHNLSNSSPFDGPDENTALSSSDEEAAATEEEGETPNTLTIRTDLDTDRGEQAELESHLPILSREDSSPHEETNEDWDGMNNELADFLGSDADEGSESEAESTRSNESDGTLTSTPGTKRKREEKTTGPADGEESDASLSASRLQKRKKKALARTTSLTHAEMVPSPSLRGGADPGGSAQGEDNGNEDDDAALEAELEAEMLRQDQEDGHESEA